MAKGLYKKTNLLKNYISRGGRWNLAGRTSAVMASLLLLSILFPISVKWTSVEATPGTANPSTTSLNLTLTNDTLSLDLAPTSSAGTFASSTPANFTVSTNNITGYTLSIKSSVTDPTDTTETTNASRLVNTVDSTKYISSISGSVAEDVFSNASNTQYNNKWGYLPSKLNSSANTSYLESPDYATATILNATECANGTLNSTCTNNQDSYSITLGARVDSTLPMGTYEHAFTIIAVGNAVNYSITYHANDGADGANTTNMPSPNPQTGNAASNETSVSLSSNKPKRDGYELKGWCTVQPTADATYPNDQACTGGTLYQPGDSFGIDQTTINAVDLYATWWEPNLLKLNGHTMQEMSPMACYNSTAYSKNNADPNHTPYDADTNTGGYHSATLTDNRDGTTRNYNVVKMPDGACWMTDNLNLGSNQDIVLTSDNTDLADGTTFTLPASDNTTFSTTNNQANVNTPTLLHNITVPDYTVNSQTYSGKIASYYNYAAATADTTTWSRASGYVTTSICPKNWDLPTESQYINLRNVGGYNIDQYHNANASYANYGRNAGDAPYNFTYGGYRNAAAGYNSQTGSGYYWTSRNNGSNNAYWTYVNSGGLYSSTQTGSKWFGAMLRCVASQGTATINYDGNGTTEYPVTGTTQAQENVEINATMTRANGFTRTGWVFNGWNTEADGSGIAITAANASTTSLAVLGLAPGSTITLYAQWLPQYTITYVHNCKQWAPSDANCTDDKSITTSTQAINLNASGNGSGTLKGYNAWTNLTGWKIVEWTENANGSGNTYPAGSSYSVTGQGAGSGITLYAHWVPVYTVQYDGNGADNSNGMGTANASGIKGVRHYNVGEGDTFDLFASNFKRDNYGFVGWSTDSSAWDHLTDNDNTNDPKIWGPNEVITAPAYNGTPIITLYAVWAPAEKDGSNNPVYLQGWTGCTDMTATTYASGALTVASDSITALTDKRDNKVYAVARLADGNCWMIENLRLDTAGTVGQNTNDNSVTNQSLSQGYGGVFNGLADSESTNFAQNTNENSLYTTASGVTGKYQLTIDSSYSSYLWTLFPRYNNTNITWNNNASGATTPTSPAQNVTSAYAHQDYNNYVYSYGNYYTWAAAMASTIYYQGYNAANAWPNNSDAADTSLCPTGWKLPKGASQNTSGSFYYMNQQMANNTSAQGSREWRMFPNNFIYSGYWNGSSAVNRGYGGYYWSSSAVSSYYAYNLYLYSSLVGPGTGSSYKVSGFSVRCVAGS